MKKLSMMLLLTTSVALSACTSPRVVSLREQCGGFSIINPDRADTLGTKQQVLVHNRVYRSLNCPETKQ